MRHKHLEKLVGTPLSDALVAAIADILEDMVCSECHDRSFVGCPVVKSPCPTCGSEEASD